MEQTNWAPERENITLLLGVTNLPMWGMWFYFSFFYFYTGDNNICTYDTLK